MKAQQVKFHVIGEDEDFGGILLDDEYIICGCCGSIYKIEEIDTLIKYNFWVDINNEIKGDD